MTVTFLAHSGFLVEWEKFYTLFDFYQGELPPLKAEKPLLVFASHRHNDHFDPRIFKLVHPDVRYYLSRDISIARRHWEKLGMTEEVFARCTAVRPDELLLTDVCGEELSIRTVKSTDIGVAFLLRGEGRMVYHAGDLNWWHWESEGKGYCENMQRAFFTAMDKLAAAVRDEAADNGLESVIDLAMLPLDPRLEDGYAMGVNELFARIAVRRALPMHMWGKFDIAERYRKEFPQHAGQLLAIHENGERFDLDG